MIPNELRADGVPMSITVADPKTGSIQAMGGYRYGTQAAHGSNCVATAKAKSFKLTFRSNGFRWNPKSSIKLARSASGLGKKNTAISGGLLLEKAVLSRRMG